jgi:GlcNAc-P-P-Und epimerase
VLEFFLFGVKFPMTSFKLGNMTIDHIVDLENTYAVCGKVPTNRFSAVKKTLEWIKKN